MTTIKYAASGEQRKKLVNALSEILECDPKYLKTPSYGYEVGSCIVNRTGDIEFPDDMTEEEIEVIIKKLTWHGFERILNESTEEVLEETKMDVTDNSDISEEIPEDQMEEPEIPVLPDGNFTSDEETIYKKTKPIEVNSEQSTSEEILETSEELEEATDLSSDETKNTYSEETPDTSKGRKLVIELPGSYLDEAELSRVRAIVASKASVLKKALETNDLSIERKEDKICFPWFIDHGIEGEAKAYTQLVSGIAKRAKMLTRVTATESASDNDKFTMRLFLVSLNFKGEEYKFARKFLLRNLSGNSSWRTEDAKARHDARKVQQEINAPEVTIEQSSEGGEDHAEFSE